MEIDFKTEIPGLTLDNYLKLGEVPSWISKGKLWLSTLLQLDLCYICLMRANIPTTHLKVVKECFLEKQGVEVANGAQLPLVVENTVRSKADEITLPPILAENDNQLLTDIKPKDFERETKRGPAVNALEAGAE